ncbi:CapA family protein [Spiractinospora alimapuensis]|uniref:CapA family protein n=1 Tax=Spiractinospora alimapuensis TaxID=2820884 RepID=UPI001F30D6BE|nr:CapA family protein [Spiractinospora alimapuensis]
MAPTSRVPMRIPQLSVLLPLVLLASCSGTQDDENPDAQQAPESSPTAEADESQDGGDDAEPFTIAFGGDTLFEGQLRDRLNTPETALGDAAEVFQTSDLAMVNLETAVTERGTPADKEFVFRAPPSAYEALSAAGVDVATVANNHGMDYGEEGLADTLDHAEEADFPLVGIGRDADEAYEPYVVDVNGNTVAMFGATDVLDAEFLQAWTAGDDSPGLASTKDESRERMLEAVREAEETADTVIVFLHWGLEGDHCPLGHAPDLAHDLIDAGANAIVGGHAHVLGPGGYYDDSYVHFGLGNFVFYNFSGPTAETGILRLTMRGDEILEDEWIPAQIQGGVPSFYENADADNALGTWEGYRETCDVGLSAEPQ